MKTIVYNSSRQYGLSRKNIADIINTLPNSYFSPIKEFHITYDSRGPERFEYDEENKIAYFEYEIDQKTDEILLDAIEELLIGLKRIKKDSSFFQILRERERETYYPFVEEWKNKCFKEIKRKK